MPISHELKLIFVHIPKTGGTSIEAALNMHTRNKNIGMVPYRRHRMDYEHLFGKYLQHMTIGQINQYLLSTKFSDYSKYGSLKHAYDVLSGMLIKKESEIGKNIFHNYYKFAVVRNPFARLVSHFSWKNGNWHKQLEPGIKDFKYFVDEVVSNKLYETETHLIPQVDYININGKCVVDKLLRQENLSKEFGELCKQLGLDISLTKRMASKHRDYREYYDDGLRDSVYAIYKADFDAFKYREEIS